MSDAIEAALLPCPFCGASPVWRQRQPGGRDGSFDAPERCLGCPNAKCVQPHTEWLSTERFVSKRGYQPADHDAEHIAAWNLRPALTAYEAAKCEGVGVKPLEWITDEFRSMECAASILGTYSVWEISGTGCYLRPDARAGVLVGTTNEDAKTAAQADYEARIRSALTSPASGERDAVIEECAKVAERDGSRHDATSSQQTAEWHARTNVEVRVADRIAAAIRAMLAKVKPHDQ